MAFQTSKLVQEPWRFNRMLYIQMVSGLLLVIFDQLSKTVLQSDLCIAGVKKINGLLNFVCVWNHGVSFGLGNSGIHTPELQRNLLIGFTGLLTLVVIYWWQRSKNMTEQWGCTLIICGAISNIIDRVHYNAVFDFLDFHAFNYHWPAFNLADSCICVGVIILFLINLFRKQPDKFNAG